MMESKQSESGTVVAFEVGDCVMHRASGERAIVTRVNSDGTLDVNLGFNDGERRLGPLVVEQFLVERIASVAIQEQFCIPGVTK